MTNEVQKSSAEFDFALAGHASTRLSESPAVKLVHSLREVKQELETAPPGELVSSFVSSSYLESKVHNEPAEVDHDSYDLRISALDTLDRDDIATNAPVLPEFVTTVETEISKVDLGRPKSAPSILSPEPTPMPSLSPFEVVENGSPPFPPPAMAENSSSQVANGTTPPQDERQQDFEEVLLMPRDEASTLEAEDSSDSLTFLDQRSLFIPREGDLFTTSPSVTGPDSAASVARPASVVNRVESTEVVRPQEINALQVPTTPVSRTTSETQLPPSPLPVDGSAAVPTNEGSKKRRSSIDSRFVLLLVGLATLVAFVVLCVWLIINIGAETGSGRSVGQADVIEFVPSDVPVVVPAVIQAEDYDSDGPGVSFNDSDDLNSGDVYRTDGVDIAAVPNQDLKLAVVETTEGEWLTYTFTVVEQGTFVVSTGVSSSVEEPGSVDISVDGNRIGTFYGESTSDEFDFKKHIIGEVEIGPGEHELRLDWSGNGGISMDWLEIARS